MSNSSPSNFSDLAKATAHLPSLRIAEIVLQTGRYQAIKDWYRAVLGRPWSIENEPKPDVSIEGQHGDGGKQVHASRVRSSFMILDKEAAATPYGQLFAVFEIPGIGSVPGKDPGLNHMQFKHGGLDDLMERVVILRDAGVLPHRSANHGPITSFYYRDPDSNVVELCCNNFATFDEWQAYFDSAAFKRNPSGIDLDFHAYLARYQGGEAHEALLKLPV